MKIARNKWNFWGLPLVMVTITTAISATADTKSKEATTRQGEVEALSRARLKALVDRDEKALTLYYSSTFSLTTDEGARADISFLRDFIKNYKGTFTFVPSNYRIELAPDGKMAATDFDLEETYVSADGSKRNVVSASFTEVYVRDKKDKGKWKLWHEHFSYKPVPKPTP